MCNLQEDAQSVCDKVFASGAELDSAVLTLSQELIDDFPVSDPRWAESIPAGECVVLRKQIESQWVNSWCVSYSY